VRRHILGFITLASFAFAAIVGCYSPLAPYQPAAEMGLRVALVLGVLWLAWPDLHRLPRWVWYVLPIGLLALRYARGMLFFLVPAFAVTTFLYLLYRKLWRKSSR
jgi:hypothetical protein